MFGMDPVTLAILGFIVLVGIIMLGKLIGSILNAVAIVLAIVNDLTDIGIIKVAPATGWLGDIITFLAILLAFRNAGALISLLDLVPSLGFLPFHTLALLVSWRIRKKKEEK